VWRFWRHPKKLKNSLSRWLAIIWLLIKLQRLVCFKDSFDYFLYKEFLESISIFSNGIIRKKCMGPYLRFSGKFLHLKLQANWISAGRFIWITLLIVIYDSPHLKTHKYLLEKNQFDVLNKIILLSCKGLKVNAVLVHEGIDIVR